MFTLQLLRPVVIPSVIKQASTIIFLHGLGDTGQSWADILPMVRPSHSKIICPNAPAQSVTLNQGVVMPAWFDLRPLDQPKDEFGIKQACEAIQEVIQTEMDNTGVPASKIILGGFSQGGAVALYTGLTLPYRLGGILALSTWLPLDKLLSWDSIQKPPILQCHGDEDDMIAIDRAEKAAKALAAVNPDFIFKKYAGLGHTIACEEELQDIHKFLENALSKDGSNKEISKL